MKRALYVFIALLTVAVIATGCGGKKEEKKAESPKIEAKPASAMPAAAPAATPAVATPAPAAPATVPAGVDPKQAKLFNTTWEVGGFNVNFVDQSKVMVKGGPLTAIAPNGLEAKYSFKDGIIEVQAMGQTRKGTWDGEKLVFDGNVATKK